MKVMAYLYQRFGIERRVRNIIILEKIADSMGFSYEFRFKMSFCFKLTFSFFRIIAKSWKLFKPLELYFHLLTLLRLNKVRNDDISVFLIELDIASKTEVRTWRVSHFIFIRNIFRNKHLKRTHKYLL